MKVNLLHVVGGVIQPGGYSIVNPGSGYLPGDVVSIDDGVGGTITLGGIDYSSNIGYAASNWKNWLRFLFNRQTVYNKIRFELRHLLAIDWEKKYRFDRVNYFISTLDVKLTMNGIDITEAELYPTGVGVLPS